MAFIFMASVVIGVFTDDQPEGGELDLDGIDDQEIDKVISFIDYYPTMAQ